MATLRYVLARRVSNPPLDATAVMNYRLVIDLRGYAMTRTDQLTATFAALADPTRRAIVARLAAGDASVTELARPFDMSQPAVSKHLKVLERAGLISRGREAQTRPCRLEVKRLREATEWMDRQRSQWEERFDRLAVVLEEMKAAERKEKGHGRKG